MGPYVSDVERVKVEGVVLSIQKYDNVVYAAAGPNASPYVYQMYTVACFKWRKNCNGRTQNR